MADVKVTIPDRDKMVGAMAKSLAVEIGGFNAVKGARDPFLSEYGFYVFHFKDEGEANEFRGSVGRYLPTLAKFVE